MPFARSNDIDEWFGREEGENGSGWESLVYYPAEHSNKFLLKNIALEWRKLFAHQHKFSFFLMYKETWRWLKAKIWLK